MIIEKSKIRDFLPKISKFAHYSKLKHKSAYMHSIKKRIARDKLRESLLKLKIIKVVNSPEVYADIAVFLKNHNSCVIFISIDDVQYSNFERFIKIINDKDVKVVNESQLKKDSKEYKMSLVLDTFLNIERLKND